MKKIIFTIVAIMMVTAIAAQIPDQIKARLITLTSKVDKLSSTTDIKRELSSFLSQAPNEEMKKAAYDIVLKKSNSEQVKKAVKELLEGVNKNKEDKGTYIVLKNATVIDAVSNTGRRGDILIREEKIHKVSYNGPIIAPQGATTYDLKGKYIIPGLIDAHVHITHGTFKDAQEQLNTALMGGVTGVRDMGGDGRMLTLLKKNTQIGEDIGADVFFSTIIAGPNFFDNDPRPQQVAKGAVAGEVSWQRSITNDSDFKQVIAEAKGLGATAIKVYDSVDKELFKKIASEAKRQGLKVWAHAVVPPTKAIDITNGGAEMMSHAGDMIAYEFLSELKGRHDFKSREEAIAYRKKLKEVKWDKNAPEVKRLFNAMKKNNSILDATLFVYYDGLSRPSNGRKVDSSRYKAAMKAVNIAKNMGVKIGAGSDHVITYGRYHQKTVNIHKELELLVQAGLSPIDALRAATIINAEGMGEEKNIGTIEEGKLANIVILDANPLENISNTRKIKAVIKRGELYEK
ncbi:amidohydrolase family protein [Aquimarina rhabdastrellae]